MDDGHLDWVHIAVARLSQELDEVRAEMAKLRGTMEEFAKKEYAARIVGRIAQRLVRLTFWGVMAVGGYAVAHWSRVKTFMDGGPR